ncbi:MAG: hypothetical protein HZB18_14955 [Chloroflexi bacterium]|nr:hypothetical protein [Chloroflexota bacterium]
MGDYNRSTKEVPFEQISPDVMQSINKYIELYNLGDILANVSLCIVSTSEKIKKGLFSGAGPKLLVETVLLTHRWLILADRVDQNAIFIKSIQLRDIVVEDYEKSLFHSKIPDTGMNVTGIFTDASEKGTVFLPLGKDAAGEKFKKMLIEATQNAKK